MIMGVGAASGQVSPVEPGMVGQEDGPVIVGQREELETFRLYNPRGGVDLLMRWQRQESRVDMPPAKRRTEHLELRESLDLASEAAILHPNFLHLELFGRFGSQQIRTSGDIAEPGVERGRSWELDYILEHDVTGTFMRQTRTPLSLYTRRSQTIFTRQFGESLDSLTTEHGARISFRSVAIPTELAFFRREQEATSQLGTTDFRIEQNTFTWDSFFSPTDQHYFTWNYTYDDVRQTGALRHEQEFERHNAFVSHSWDFGGDGGHTLRSSALLYKETGEFEVTRIRWNENLRLRHSERFETFYDYTLDRAQRPVADQTLHRGHAGFRHRLFESVTTVGMVGGSRLTLDDGERFTSNTGFGDLEIQYSKRVPLGRLAASTGVNYTRQDESGRDGSILVLQEPHTFSPAGIVVLQRRNIIPSSIVVMDANGIFTFSPGLDYTVQAFGDRVEIRRVLGGDIGDGQSVLIDYRIETEPANVTDTLGWRAAVRYDIEEGWLAGLGLYGRYAQQDQSRRADTGVFLEPLDVRDLTLGADYRIGYLTLLAERQWHDSTLSPFNALRLESRYSHPFGKGSSLLLTGTYNEIDRYEDEIQTQITTLNGRWNQQVSENLRLGLELQWRDERDRPGFHIQGFEQQLDVSWRYRQTSVYGLVRNASLDGDASDSTFQTIELGVRRAF